MFTKTSAIIKNSYFKSASAETPEGYQKELVQPPLTQVSHVYVYDKPVYLTAQSGISLLVVSNHLSGDYERFILEGSIKIPPRTFFNVISIAGQSQVTLAQDASAKAARHDLDSPIAWAPDREQLQVAEVYTLQRASQSSGFQTETQDQLYHELLIAERGSLEVSLEGSSYKLDRYDTLLLPPQLARRLTVVSPEAAYVSVFFDMKTADASLFNHSFHLGAGQISQLEALIRISEADSYPYQHDQLVTRLKLLLLSLISNTHPILSEASSVKERHDQELCQKMTDYIKAHPGSRVIDVSKAFGVSRSNIQALFHRFIHMQPRAYIEAQRLNQAKALIRESNHSLTEIAELVGYHSLPAFSRSFKHAFGYPPSHYAKQNYTTA